MVDALAARLPDGSVRLDRPVSSIEQDTDGQWKVGLEQSSFETFDRVILTVGAPAAAKLLSAVDSELTNLLTGIPYAGTSVVCLGYRRAAVDHPLDGFGFVVPAVENRQILAGSFSSVKYPGRAAVDRVLIRVFVGGALQGELAELPRDELIAAAHRELAELIGVRGEPEMTHVMRWHGAMPQYHVGHLDRVAQIEARVAALSGLELAGNAYRGVGVPQCIHSGETAAERALSSHK